MSKNTKKGFTIIEVVLVLAIAGLIFLMVFVALPALRRSQADTQRRSDAASFMAQMNQYQTNNRGAVVSTPEQLTDFLTNYMKQKPAGAGEFVEPGTGANYAVTYASTQPTTVGAMTYSAGYICNGEAMTNQGAGPRNAALVVKLDGSGFYCTDLK